MARCRLDVHIMGFSAWLGISRISVLAYVRGFDANSPRLVYYL